MHLTPRAPPMACQSPARIELRGHQLARVLARARLVHGDLTEALGAVGLLDGLPALLLLWHELLHAFEEGLHTPTVISGTLGEGTCDAVSVNGGVRRQCRKIAIVGCPSR